MAFLFGLLGRGFSRMGSAGGKPHGGPFLLLVSGSPSKLLLQNGSSRLLITNPPAAAFVPTFYILGF